MINFARNREKTRNEGVGFVTEGWKIYIKSL